MPKKNNAHTLIKKEKDSADNKGPEVVLHGIDLKGSRGHGFQDSRERRYFRSFCLLLEPSNPCILCHF